jgi:hypothetical protein
MSGDLLKRLRGLAGRYEMIAAANRIEDLEYALRSIADTPIGKEVPDRTTAWGLAFHMQQTAKDALKEGKHE